MPDAIPSDTEDIPTAETIRFYDYDLYGPLSAEEDDVSNESASPVLPLVTQSCYLDTASPFTGVTRGAIGRSFGQLTASGGQHLTDSDVELLQACELYEARQKSFQIQVATATQPPTTQTFH